MKRNLFIAVLLVILSCGVCRAETTIKAELDKKSINADETVTYKISIISSEQRLPQPEFPDFAGLAVLSQSQSSSISFGEEGMRTLLVYVFVLLPSQTGKITVAPAKITVAGKELISEAFTLQVAPSLSGRELTPSPRYDI